MLSLAFNKAAIEEEIRNLIRPSIRILSCSVFRQLSLRMQFYIEFCYNNQNKENKEKTHQKQSVIQTLFVCPWIDFCVGVFKSVEEKKH